MNVFRAAAITGLVQILGVVAFLSCVTPLPPTPVPTPVPSGDAPRDPFAGVTADCSTEFYNPPVDNVRKCLDAGNTATCMSDLVVGTVTPDVIVCTARGIGMALHVAIARGGASDDVKSEAVALDFWIRAEGISIRD